MRFLFVTAASLLLFPASVSAHEVYVLSHDAIAQALRTPAFSELGVIRENLGQFMLWGFIAALIIFAVFFISVLRVLERKLDPLLAHLPMYAPVICRVTIGLAFLVGAYSDAVFGPELPLSAVFAGSAAFMRGVLFVIGTMLVIGFYTRVAALIGTLIFGFAAYVYGVYLFTYLNYLGELLLLLVLGAHRVGFHHKGIDAARVPRRLLALKERLTPYMIPLLRVSFGIALIYASVYAKIIHNNLALAVTVQYPDIVSFFGFEPHFLVLGAAIIEILIGMFFVLGIEIRFTALFLLFWLSLSLWYFGEVVWPHLILIGIPIAFICYGYDKYSLEGHFFKRQGREPVL